jgi:glutamate racemase
MNTNPEARTENPEPRSRPIGIFDSGVGGLSVLREVRRELPHEDVLYVADSGHAPYGDKPAAEIDRRAEAIVGFLIGQGAKAIVVACNTATGVSVDRLRERWPMPIVGIEPAIKPAAAATKSGVVGVLATSQTIASARFSKLVETFAGGATILSQPCPGLVEQVEEGDLAGPVTAQLVESYVRPLLDRGADTLVLGCTHYPFVADVIAAVAGPGVAVIDPSAAVARELRRRLEQARLTTPAETTGSVRFWTGGPPDHLRDVARRVGMDVTSVDALPV